MERGGRNDGTMTGTPQRMATGTRPCPTPVRPAACAVLGLLLVFSAACAGPAAGRAGGGGESIAAISCKNESAQEIRDARVVVDGRSFTFGSVAAGTKKTMAAGDVASVERFLVIYAFHPAGDNPGSTAEQAVEYPGARLAALAKRADELEAVYFGDGRWAMRVFERGADPGKSVVWEMAMTEALAP